MEPFSRQHQATCRRRPLAVGEESRNRTMCGFRQCKRRRRVWLRARSTASVGTWTRASAWRLPANEVVERVQHTQRGKSAERG